MRLQDCNQCPLRSNIPEGIGPCEPHAAKTDLMIVSYQPTEDQILLGIEAGTEYDLLSKLIKTPFYYTYLIKCLGEAKKLHVSTCMAAWLYREINFIKPKRVIMMGKEVSYHLVPQIKRSDSIRKIAGKEYTIDEVSYIPTYSSASILNGGRSSIHDLERILNS